VLDPPASLLYVAVIYTTVIAVILWAGLGIYLAITANLKQRLLRGLLVILLVTVPSLFAGMFLRNLPSQLSWST
jgi:hypothetical protein